MRIKWVRLALNDLEDLTEYIAQDNPDAAKRLVERIWEATQMLKDNPEIGRPGRIVGTRELVIGETSYLVPYRVKNNVIQILRVFHGVRKWPEKL